MKIVSTFTKRSDFAIWLFVIGQWAKKIKTQHCGVYSHIKNFVPNSAHS